MKRRIKSIAILLVFFCLTACNQTETKSDDTKQVSGLQSQLEQSHRIFCKLGRKRTGKGLWIFRRSCC